MQTEKPTNEDLVSKFGLELNSANVREIALTFIESTTKEDALMTALLKHLTKMDWEKHLCAFAWIVNYVPGYIWSQVRDNSPSESFKKFSHAICHMPDSSGSWFRKDIDFILGHVSEEEFELDRDIWRSILEEQAEQLVKRDTMSYGCSFVPMAKRVLSEFAVHATIGGYKGIINDPRCIKLLNRELQIL